MASEKKKYEKPMIMDLGRIATAKGQGPRSLCSTGISPSGLGQQCSAGGQVSIPPGLCDLGGLPDIDPQICDVGVGARDVCDFGSVPA
jgi:hypothetical protein